MANDGDRTFVKITNSQIYQKLIDIETQNEWVRTHVKILYAGMTLMFTALGVVLTHIWK